MTALFTLLLACVQGATALSANASIVRDIEYVATVAPEHATLGQPLLLTVTMKAVGASVHGPSLKDKSLTITLEGDGIAGEAPHAFPNRVSVQADSLVMRGGERDDITLRAGERRSRTFSLQALFPVALLRVGAMHVGVSVYDGSRERRAIPARFRIQSGAAAVPMLLARLSINDQAVRERASALLHRMTGQGITYEPLGDSLSRAAAVAEWNRWWHSYGSHLAWDVTGVGQVRYRRVRLTSRDRTHMVNALEQWRRTGAASDLRGHRYVADAVISYPDASAMLDDAPVEQALHESLVAMSERASRGVAQADDVVMLMSTIVRVRAITPFGDALARLESQLGAGASWSRARAATTAARQWSTPATEP